jgi:hypothetical protein
MKHFIPTAKKLIVGVVAVGALTVGAAGMAGAATTGTASATPARVHTFNCANAPKVLARIQKVEGDIANGLPKLTAAQAKASAAGKTKVAARLQKRITRLESSTFKARLDKITAAIDAKCNVSTPGATS